MDTRTMTRIFVFVGTGMLIYILCLLFPLKMTKLRIRHNQCFIWMTMMTMAPESGISEDNSFP